MIDPETALEKILSRIEPVGSETVPLDELSGRISAEPLTSRLTVPPFDNSAMDGIALRAADTASASEDSPVSLVLRGESRAGHPFESTVGPGEAITISTGAMVPDGCDTIVPVEQIRFTDGRSDVLVFSPSRPGTHLRPAGDDFSEGETLFGAGRRIGPAELGTIVSAGRNALACAARPSVALVTSGDELVDPGRDLGPGQIHNSSAWAMAAEIELSGATVKLNRTIGDDPAETSAAIGAALESDLVIICGGMSVGEYDFIRDSLAETGVEEVFFRISMKPGKPTWFGVKEQKGDVRPVPVFGLPGNPVSTIVTFRLFVLPAVRKMLGLDPSADTVDATFDDEHERNPSRTEFVRCRVSPGPDGWHASLVRPKQGSHILTSLLDADGLGEIPAGEGVFGPGERLKVRLIDSH